MRKYGVNYFNNIEKQKQTVFNKYGVQSVSNIPEVKTKKKSKLKESKKKEYITKKQNNSFNKSKPEEYFYNYLLHKYSKEDIVRQYRDERYPFACDFYIKSQDLFIELNLTWTHGGHAFNKQNKEDLNKLKKWKDKSSNSDFYKNAIYTWTDLDVRKLNYMLENNLNFKIYYSIKEIQELIV